MGRLPQYVTQALSEEPIRENTGVAISRPAGDALYDHYTKRFLSWLTMKEETAVWISVNRNRYDTSILSVDLCVVRKLGVLA